MILRHYEIEEFRSDPKSFLKKVKEREKKKDKINYKSAYRNLQLSAFHYHKVNSAKAAQKYLINSFQNFKNKKNLLTTETQLARYIENFTKSGNSVIKYRDRINEQVGNDVFLKGEIHRLDRKKNGLPIIYIFQKESIPDWKKELRIPILQKIYSKVLNVNLEEVSVGTYAFDISSYDEISLSKSRVKNAYDEFQELIVLLEGI